MSSIPSHRIIPWYENNERPYVMIDVLNWKTLEKSYGDLCKRFGEDAIPKYTHQYLFKNCTRQSQLLLSTETKINDIVFNESMYVRYQALQDAISRCPIFISYKEIYRTIKNISYPEFEFWYYRFYNGERDLNYDRSKDPKSLTFSDLPVDVVEKIVGKSEIRPRCMLRRVSRGLRSIVDSSKLFIEKFTIIINECSISINMDDIKKSYYPPFNWRHAPEDEFKNPSDEFCSRLATFIGNSKLQLESFGIHILHSGEESKSVVGMLKSIPHQLRVRNLKIRVDTKEELMDIILCMKPKILKKLEINFIFEGSQGIIDSEQWKHAEEVCLNNTVSFEISYFFHLKSFDIWLTMDSMESMIELRDVC